MALLRSRDRDWVANVLERAAGLLRESRGVDITAGVGPAFTELADMRTSYTEAQRALRHASPSRPFVVGPGEVHLFDELTLSAERGIAALIPDQTRAVLEDPTLRKTLEAFSDANLSVAVAAQRLYIHPNTLRYRLGRIAERSGRDPRVIRDLLELMAASHVLGVRDDSVPSLKRARFDP